MTSEKATTDAIRTYLKSIGAKVIKTHGSVYGRKGTPDLLGSYQGRALAFEVKKPGKKPTRLQKKELREWAEAGAIAGRVESVQEVEELIKEITEP